MDFKRYNDLIVLFTTNTDKNQDSCRDSETFSQIKDILEVGNNPNRDSSTINWKAIDNLSYKILSQNDKDLLVACYMGIAMLHTYGISGLSMGLKVINAMIKDCWEDIYPPLKRINGRWAAVEWLNMQLNVFVENDKNEYLNDDISNIKIELTNLDKNFVSLNDDPPNLLPLIKSFNNLKIKQEIIHIEQPVEDTEIQSEKVAINSIDDAVSRVEELFNELDNISEYMINSDSCLDTKNFGYRLSRFSMWKNINKLPNYDTEHRTKIAPIDKWIKDKIKYSMQVEDYTNLIVELETWIKDNPFGIDLHFSLYNAMVLNKCDSKISNTIKSTCMNFVFRFPKLKELRFSDNSKIISDETFKWLLSDLSFADNSINNSKDTNDDFIKKLMDVSSQPKGNKITYLIDVYNQYSNEISNYKKIDFYIILINELVDTTRLDLLKIYVNILEKDFNFYNLDSLDKTLAVKALKALIRAKKAMNEDYNINYSVLCEIDMKQALNI